MRNRLDHVAINVRNDLDGAAELFAGLGFTLTPRGFHSLGSMNHLMMFGSDYLELIAVPGGDTRRQDLLDAPIGINGIVFGTDDVDTVFARLGELELAGDPPRSFHRPVEVDDSEGDGDGDRSVDARFRTVTVRSDVFPGGRVYFCHHLTPELVWQPSWQQHANRTTAIAGAVVVSTEPETEAARFGLLLDVEIDVSNGASGEYVLPLEPPHRITVVAPDRYHRRYGLLASPMGDRPSIFGAVELLTADRSELHRRASALDGVQVAEPTDDQTIIRIDPYDTVLDVRAIDPHAVASSATTGV